MAARIAIELWAEGLRNRGLIPSRGKKPFSSPQHPDKF
jgi:hypothetical protein